MKTCTKCGAEKPLSEFHNNKRSKDGLSYYCKSCANEYELKWREDNRERKKESSRKWREENREKAKEGRRKYRKKNQERINEYHRKWLKDNDGKSMEYTNRYRANKRSEKMMWVAMDMAGMIDNG